MHLSDERIRHMLGVASYMEREAPTYNLNPRKMYLLGLLHEIGYIKSGNDINENTYEVLQEINFPYADVIKYLDKSPAEIRDNMTLELLLLLEADCVIEESGERAGVAIGMDEKYKKIKERYGEDSREAKLFLDKITYLKN